jgi:hypothetical protein
VAKYNYFPLFKLIPSKSIRSPSLQDTKLCTIQGMKPSLSLLCEKTHIGAAQ